MVPETIVHAGEAAVVNLLVTGIGHHVPADLAISGDLTVDLETPEITTVERDNHLTIGIACANPGAYGNLWIVGICVVEIADGHVRHIRWNEVKRAITDPTIVKPLRSEEFAVIAVARPVNGVCPGTLIELV